VLDEDAVCSTVIGVAAVTVVFAVLLLVLFIGTLVAHIVVNFRTSGLTLIFVMLRDSELFSKFVSGDVW
jgi:hypothetical protein